MLANIVQEALLRGVQFGGIQVIDIVHSIEDENTDKDQKQQK